MQFIEGVCILVIFLVGTSAKPAIRTPQPDTDNVTMATSEFVDGCGILQGPPGHDGRDGLPGPPAWDLFTVFC